MIKTTSTKITLTARGRRCLNNIRKEAKFRSDSSTIEETLIFVQALRDNPPIITLKVLGERFGIHVKEES